MLEEELVNLAENIYNIKAEKQNVEVKAAHGGCPKRLYDTLSSFSNQDGGGILLLICLKDLAIMQVPVV